MSTQHSGRVNSTTHRLEETDAISNNPEEIISMETHATDCKGLFHHTHDSLQCRLRHKNTTAFAEIVSFRWYTGYNDCGHKKMNPFTVKTWGTSSWYLSLSNSFFSYSYIHSFSDECPSYIWRSGLADQCNLPQFVELQQFAATSILLYIYLQLQFHLHVTVIYDFVSIYTLEDGNI